MFNNLLNSVFKAVSGFLGSSSKPSSPAPVKPAPLKPLPQLPAINWQIPTWNQYQSGTYNYTAANAANSRQVQASTSASNAIAEQARINELARVALAEKMRREAEERERKRREKQAAFDSVKNSLLEDRRRQAKFALDQLSKSGDKSDWRTYFDESGNFKGARKNQNGDIIPNSWYDELPDYVTLRQSWSDWYNSDDGLIRRTQDDYRDRVNHIIDSSKKAPNTGFLGQLFDKVTFGGTRRAMTAREQAAKLGEQTMHDQTKRFEDMTDQYYKDLAKHKQAIEAAKTSGSWSEYNKAVETATTWETKELDRIRYAQGAITGMLEGYQGKSTEKINNIPGKIGGWLQQNILDGPLGKISGNVWKYTLGQGDQTVPSLVTTPARAMNTFLNAFSGNRPIVDKSGDTRNSTGNPWLDSHNQSNFNATYASTTFDNYALNKYKEIMASNARGGSIMPASNEFLNLNKPPLQFDAAAFNKWKNANSERLKADWEKSERNAKSTYLFANDIAGDPMSYFGAFKAPISAPKASSFLSRASEIVKDSKLGSKFIDAASALKNNKVVTWLNSEAKSPQTRYTEAVQDANKVIDQAQSEILPRFRSQASRLMQERNILAGKFDDTILDDFRIMAAQGDDQAAKWLQEMRNGDFSNSAKIQNWTRAGGIGSNPRLTNLRSLASRWSDFAEQMAKSDKVSEARRFGKGRDRSFYSPNTRYFKTDPEQYNFHKFKQHPYTQSAKDMYRGMVDRYFKSDVIDSWGSAQKSKVSRLDGDMKSLLNEYDSRTTPAREKAQKAYDRTRTPLGRTQGFLTQFGPTALWKKSVLKYRPAWYVNNFLYNTQATALAGGADALVDQFRLMRPKNYRAAINDLPPELRSNIASEIGRDKLSKFGSGVENISRMAAFRSLKKRGFTDEQALKRVNSYLFDYSTKRYELPIKTVMPFYSFQKGLAKAALKMPGDAPLAAMGYNRLDRSQKDTFYKEFDTKVAPQMKRLGYTDTDIATERNKQAERFSGRLKVGDQYYRTPFNPFSEDGGFGAPNINPWLTSFAEATTAKDHFNRSLSGSDSSLTSRIIDKFPAGNFSRTTSKIINDDRWSKWIGAPGSSGFGMTKEAQGYDSSKVNYKRSLDPASSFVQDIKAFFGVPRGLKFDADSLVQNKKFSKLKDEYFATDWKSLPFAEQQQKRDALFTKFGISAAEFYDGELAKYDSANAKKIKSMKDDAFLRTQELFNEYSKQPLGTRNVWATNKLKELVDAGYFATNPFLKSFDWTSPDTIAKAHKQMSVTSGTSPKSPRSFVSKKSQKSLDYATAKSSGNWTSYNAKYGTSSSPSAKKIARDHAVSTGDWSAYAAKYGTSRSSSPYQYAGKFFKTQESMQHYIEGEFWRKYAAASKADRRQLLADNPQYNKRSSWTDQMWDDWKAQTSADRKQRALKNSTFYEFMQLNLAMNKKSSAPVLAKKSSRSNKLAFATL